MLKFLNRLCSNSSVINIKKSTTKIMFDKNKIKNKIKLQSSIPELYQKLPLLGATESHKKPMHVSLKKN